MARGSHRVLTLLSMLATRRQWSRSELSARLGVDERTVRRDVETLREAGYSVRSTRGPNGGYQLGETGSVPVAFDEAQALAIAVALQTAPSSVFGLEHDAQRALETLSDMLPARLRATVQSVRVTRLRNHWDFHTPPIEPELVKAISVAVQHRQILIVEVLRGDGVPHGAGRDGFLRPSSTRTASSGRVGGALVCRGFRSRRVGLAHSSGEPPPATPTDGAHLHPASSA